MPLDRLRSPRGSHGRRLTSLTDFEFRVWDQYQLSADDFGVMRCSAVTIRDDNANLEQRPEADIQAALERLIQVGLVLAFEFQGRRYICQDDWQEFQRVEYPRRTMLPFPTGDVLAACSEKTRLLFQKHPGGESKRRPSRGEARDSQGFPEESPRSSQGVPEGSPSDHQGFSPPRVTANTNGKRLTQTANTDAPVTREAPAYRTDGPLAGGLPKDHLNHAACSPNFAVCVPSAVHGKLRAAVSPKFKGELYEADEALRAWYHTVWEGLPSDFVMGDAFKFWQLQFDAKWADQASPPKTSVQSVASLKAAIEEQNALTRRDTRA